MISPSSLAVRISKATASSAVSPQMRFEISPPTFWSRRNRPIPTKTREAIAKRVKGMGVDGVGTEGVVELRRFREVVLVMDTMVVHGAWFCFVLK